MDEATERLLNHLGTGQRNAKKREALAVEMELPDREMRRVISRARTVDRVPICNFQNGRGYFLPETDEELLEQYRQTVRRGKSIFAQTGALLHAIGLHDQMTLEQLIQETEAIV